VKPVRPLVLVPHGSVLYGTNTPESDQDFKAVHLPSGRAIILGRPENVLDTSSVVKGPNGKNQAGSVDQQSFSLQNFFAMLAKGDTVATEILFAPPIKADPNWLEIQALGRSFLNRECRGFVGYCQRQAAKYGIKGSRMAAVKKLRDFLEIQEPQGGKLQAVKPLLRHLSQGEEHMTWENIPHPDGRDCWHIVCCDRKMPMTSSIGEAFKVFDKVWVNYGERARAAMTNDGIDWKAVSHAVRVARQAIELLTTGEIQFPRPDREELLAIKLGQVPYAEVSPMLEALVQQVEATESILPEKTDMAAIDEAVLFYYQGQLG
jgi:predicted nucleotidyltransferase